MVVCPRLAALMTSMRPMGYTPVLPSPVYLPSCSTIVSRLISNAIPERGGPEYFCPVVRLLYSNEDRGPESDAITARWMLAYGFAAVPSPYVSSPLTLANTSLYR